MRKQNWGQTGDTFIHVCFLCVTIFIFDLTLLTQNKMNQNKILMARQKQSPTKLRLIINIKLSYATRYGTENLCVRGNDFFCGSSLHRLAFKLG